MLLFIDLQVKLKMIFLSFSQNFELALEELSENNPYLLARVRDFNANLDFGIAKALILLTEFKLKMEHLNLNSIKY